MAMPLAPILARADQLHQLLTTDAVLRRDPDLRL